jgi:hypothetical protein
MKTPTVEQVEQCRLAEQDIIEVINRLQTEGMDLRVIMAAIGTATVKVLTPAWGEAAAFIWFARQSAMAMPIAERG